MLPNDPRLKSTDFVVEATNAEHFFLWREFHDRTEWKEGHLGYMETIGHVQGRPVCICLTWDVIDGMNVMFVDATSQLVDWEMVERWLDRHCNPKWDNSTRQARTDAMNFHHVLHAAEERKAAQC